MCLWLTACLCCSVPYMQARKEAEREAERQEAMRRAELALQAARPDEARDDGPLPMDHSGRDGSGGGSGLGSSPAGGNLGLSGAPTAAASGEEAFLRRGRRVPRSQVGGYSQM